MSTLNQIQDHAARTLEGIRSATAAAQAIAGDQLTAAVAELHAAAQAAAHRVLSARLAASGAFAVAVALLDESDADFYAAVATASPIGAPIALPAPVTSAAAQSTQTPADPASEPPTAAQAAPNGNGRRRKTGVRS